MSLDVRQVVTQLNQELGPTLVAVLAGTRDRELPKRWAEVGGPEPDAAAVPRLKVAHRVWIVINERDGADLARAWFTGLNPRLGDTLPVVAIREDRFEAVLACAEAITEDPAWS